LDIGLPDLDGIEAARPIRKVAPEYKILFLSQEIDPVVVRAALTARNTVTSLRRAYSELSLAVGAIMLGSFVSPGLADR
jgi:DNA-binding NarL/FixJ family response regulator